MLLITITYNLYIAYDTAFIVGMCKVHVQDTTQLHYLICMVKTHSSVSCAQENGACTNGVSILTGTTKSHFHQSMMPYLNGTKFTVWLASTRGGHISYLNKILLVVPKI